MDDYRAYEMTPVEGLCFFAGLAGVLIVCGILFYGNLIMICLLPLLWKKSKELYCRYRAEKRRNQLLLQFRDFLYSLSGSFAAGRHMEEALEEAGRNLADIYGGSMMEAEAAAMVCRIRETGQSELEAVEDFAARSGLPDAEDFAEVFGACRKTGGDMVAAVNKAAAVIGEKIGVEQEIRTMVSQKKLEGRIITAMPLLVIVFLQCASPDYLSMMYTTLAGRILMSGALCAMAGAGLMIERITQIDI